MAFYVKLYKNSADPKRVDKTDYLTPVSSGDGIICQPTENCDILNPTFILDYSESYIGANYCYCALFGGRYYFINDMSIDIGKKIVIKCSVDVLHTYRNDIEGAWGCIVRAETIEGNVWGVGPIADEKLPVNSRRNVETIKFGNSPFLGGGDEVLWEVYNGIPKQPQSIVLNIGDYFYWQKWKYEIDGSADSARADIVGESLPGPSDIQVHNGTLITIGGYRYKVRVGSEYTSLYLSPYN